MTTAEADENQGDEWGLTWYLQWGIYTSIPTWTHSYNSLAATETSNLKISPMEHPSNDHEDHSNQHENSHKLCDERGIARWTWWKVNGNWNNIIRISEWRESHCRKIILPEERNKSKRAGLWQLQSGIRAGTLTIWVRLFEIWKTVTATISIGSTKIGCKSLWLTLKSPKEH